MSLLKSSSLHNAATPNVTAGELGTFCYQSPLAGADNRSPFNHRLNGSLVNGLGFARSINTEVLEYQSTLVVVSSDQLRCVGVEASSCQKPSLSPG